MYNLSLTACSFHLKVKNSKSKEKIFPLNRTIAVTREEGEPLSFKNAKELFYLFFRSHGDMIDLNRENIRGFDVREFYVQLVSDLREKGF